MPNAPLKIVYRRLDKLRPTENNPRTHSDAQIEQIARSIMAFGWTNPVLIDEDYQIIAGHGRLAAAQSLGIEQVPTITLTDLSDEQRRALIIADNQLALNAGWNAELLALELGELKAMEFDVTVIGFTEQQIDQMLEPAVDPRGEWQGMPEFEHGPKGIRSIIVHFKTPEAVQEFARLLDQKITDQTRYVWHPAVEPERLRDWAYETDESNSADLHSLEGSPR